MDSVYGTVVAGHVYIYIYSRIWSAMRHNCYGSTSMHADILFSLCLSYVRRDCVNGSKAFLNPGGYCSKEFGCTNYSTCFGTVHLPKDLFAVSCHF